MLLSRDAASVRPSKLNRTRRQTRSKADSLRRARRCVPSSRLPPTTTVSLKEPLSVSLTATKRVFRGDGWYLGARVSACSRDCGDETRVPLRCPSSGGCLLTGDGLLFFFSSVKPIRPFSSDLPSLRDERSSSSRAVVMQIQRRAYQTLHLGFCQSSYPFVS